MKYVELNKDTGEYFSGPWNANELPNPELMHTIPVEVDESVTVCFEGQIYDPQTKTMVHTEYSLNEMCLRYLADTDWYVTRKTETGIEIPQDILNKRQECRDSIVRSEYA